MKKRYFFPLILIMIFFLGSIFTSITIAQNKTIDLGNESLDSKRGDDLESPLIGLLNSSDKSSFAEQHDLTLKNGSIRVVIELVNTTEPPENYDINIESEYEVESKKLIQGFVKLEDLKSLALKPEVSTVRTPEKSVPSGSTENSSSNMSIIYAAIILVMLLFLSGIYRRRTNES